MKKITLLLLCALMSVMSFAQETITSGGISRKMIVYAPSNLGQNRPLLISMHGMNQDCNYQKNQANYEAVADTAKFVVVYPDGIDKGWDISGTRDVNFILDIIEAMVKRYNIDRNRVYLSGFSMGGMMTYHAANKIADKIAAFAPCSGYPMGGPNPQSSRPIPIFHVHGTGDDVCVYSSVQSHLDAWVKYNGCNTTPTTEKPKSGPANTTAEIIRYKNGKRGVEVAHLKMPGKGHWHSNDPAMAMANVEIWRWLSRWSLTPGPQVKSVSPEVNSFDLPADCTFTFQLDKAADASRAICAITGPSSTIRMAAAEKGYTKTLTYSFPANNLPADGEWRLQLRELYSEDGGTGSNFIAWYAFGVEEVGETMKIDTLLTQDWYAQQAAIQEGIPTGWHRVNSKSDGSKDEQTSGASAVAGARMKYFVPGGDFDAGFYFSARDYDKCTFTYGEYNPKLTFDYGRYKVSFRSVYWNDGANNNKDSFAFSLINASTGKSISGDGSLRPSGCMSEKTDRQVKGSALHEVECEVMRPATALLEFSIATGWNGIILGPPTITRCPSFAELYKGEFFRTLKNAQYILDYITAESHPDYAAQLAQLSSVVAQYKDFASCAPSEYTAAIKALTDAIKPVHALSLNQVSTTDAAAPMYDLLGLRVTAVRGGIYFQAGRKIVVK